MHGMLAWLFLQVFADTAEGPYLERWARIWGIFRKGAAHAVGPVDFPAQDGSLIPAGILMQHQPTGLLYAVQADAAAQDAAELYSAQTGGVSGGQSPPIPTSGSVISLIVRAVIPGAASNQPPGTSLALIAPIAGIMSGGTVMPDGITGGVDEEDDDSLRQRLLDRLREPPRGGAKHDYEFWAREVPGVTRAWCYPMGLGIGTVSLTFVTDNAPTGPIPTPEMVKRVQDHIEPLRPATVKEWLAFAPTVLPIVISLSVTPNTEAVRQAVRRELGDLIARVGVPGTVILVNNIRQAISVSPGVIDYTLHAPTANIDVHGGYFPMLQDVTFEEMP